MKNNSIIICQEKEAVMKPEPLLDEICEKLEDEILSTTTICVSMICLVVMIVIYILLPTLHNVPGYIVISQVRFYLYS